MQVTEDHSLVWEQVQRGLIPRESLETHPQRNILTRALGIASHVSVDIFPLRLNPHDVILLCSDGLYPVVAHEDICGALAERTLEDACDHLIVTANAHGGPDNITLAMVQIPNG
jgi:serine/threonine protein phosphatase PrpC